MDGGRFVSEALEVRLHQVQCTAGPRFVHRMATLQSYTGYLVWYLIYAHNGIDRMTLGMRTECMICVIYMICVHWWPRVISAHFSSLPQFSAVIMAYHDLACPI